MRTRTRRSFPLTLLSLILLAMSAQAVDLPAGFSDNLVADKFDTPVGLAPLPDRRIVVLEQYSGRVYLLGGNDSPSRSLIHTFTDLNAAGGNERGLLGAVADPNFGANGYLYFYYTATGNHSQLTRFTLKESSHPKESPRLDSRLDILSDIPDNAWNHNGGTLRFGPDSMLYLSLGDDASSCLAQSISDARGSILRLDVRFSIDSEAKLKAGDKSVLIAKGNPLAISQAPNAQLIYAYGLRNPFRFDIDPLTGDMMIADVGLLDFEEIDFVPSSSGGGENFGWPFFEGPAPRAQPGCKRVKEAKYIQPVAYYDRTGFVASVISLCIYRPSSANGKFTWPKEYFGDYFYTDYFAGFVRRLKLNKQGGWITPATVAGQTDSSNWATNLKSVPDAFVGADGALYYLRQFDDTFSPKSGQLRRIIYQKPRPSEE